MTAAELGKRLGGLTARSARRYWAAPRQVYESTSLAKRKPWADAGISRTTWYRRRKRKREPTAAPLPNDSDSPTNGSCL
jgi:hypothetical protein